MKINNIDLFLIIILILKSKNDSDSNNTSTIFSTNSNQYSTNEINSETNISLNPSDIISTFNNNKNIIQSKSNISSMNTTNKTTKSKKNSTFPIYNNTSSSLIEINNIIEPTVNKSINNNNLFFLQLQVMDYILNIYLFYEQKYPNSLKAKIYIDTPSGDQLIIRERLFVIANYSRNNNNIIEYTSNLTDYLNTDNFSVTIEKIDIIEDENEYDIYFGVDENNLNSIKAENFINNGSFNFSDVFNKTNYNYFIYDVKNISKGCKFYINLTDNRTIYDGKKNIELNFTEYYNGSVINAKCILSSKYRNQIDCNFQNNEIDEINGNYTIKPYVYPFEDEIFIFRQKKEQVFRLFCNKTKAISHASTKIIAITTVASIIIGLAFLVLLVVACFKHRDNLSPVSNKSVLASTNPIIKEGIVDSSMALNK